MFGQRPMYFYDNSEHLIISSKVNIFFRFGVTKEINNNKILQFILNEHIKDGSTFYKNIKKIHGGNFFSFKNKKIYIKKFVDPAKLINNRLIKKKTIAKDFRELYENVISSIVRRIDGKVASTLSGGLTLRQYRYLQINLLKTILNHFQFILGDYHQMILKTDEAKFIQVVLNNSTLKHTHINLDYSTNGPINNPHKIHLDSQPYGIINGFLHESIFDECNKRNIRYLFDGLFWR